MSADWGKDDLERLIALESSFSIIALMCANNFAHFANIPASAAAKHFGDAAKGASLDNRELSPGIRLHIARLFDHVEAMAKTAEAAMDAAGVKGPGVD